jgi:hypothetical protein
MSGLPVDLTEIVRRCAPLLALSHERHTRPVVGCLRCEDQMAEAREIEDEWHPVN